MRLLLTDYHYIGFYPKEIIATMRAALFFLIILWHIVKINNHIKIRKLNLPYFLALLSIKGENKNNKKISKQRK